ncbi:stress-inducible protein [Plasmopara halstedii]|uniref:Hsp70-Hsp90 organising protein n=1 Tax=Plasmopara halstedii TaxID=4781 RepID=A0A0P1B717_PLAHL|nr:stress-inducible protein [Plasmopara halstedii]CEG50332.1 stress-inducible protein [Plasmopara halstedii]|eukprot:XP_024586701.1 stress-inducible protein [Plasmopara halstedii]
MAAEQAKSRGNRAFAAGLYSDAVACFSEALAIAPTDPNVHVFYSNRSAALLKLDKADKALEDADKCITIKPKWPKGYSRRGAALYALGRYADAYRAYKDGLSHDTSNSGLLEGLKAVEVKLATQGAGISSSTSSTSSPLSTSTIKSFLFGSKRNIFQLYQFILRTMLLLCFINFWIPMLLSSSAAYGNFFKVALVNHTSYLAFTHGAPRWSAAYSQRLLLDPAAQILFFCLVFWVSDPHGLAMMPVFLLEMVHYFSYVQSLLEVLGLGNLSIVTFVTTKALVPLTALIISDPSFPALTTHAKWTKLYSRMPQVAANIDLAIGISLIVEMLLPTRNFLLLILYWQVLRVRYMISPQLQEAFRMLHASILSAVSHPRCPSVIGNVYGKLHGFITKMGDSTAQHQSTSGTGGLASRCNIM